MFTGIVEGPGKVLAVTKRGRSARIRIQPSFASRLKSGESLAVNGCCLTVEAQGTKWLEADLSFETLRVTNLGHLCVGDRVNLERAMKLGDRINGHWVQGHVDGVGRILKIEKARSGTVITIRFPKHLRPYFISKGSVTVDGVSMTINRLRVDSFSLVVIPHTLRRTNLGGRSVGDRVNLEVDMVGKYLQSFKQHA